LQLSNDSRTIAEILKQREEKRIEREQAANLAVQKEQEEQAAQKRSSKAITPDLPTEEPDNSLSMRDEHLSTIPETKSNEVIKSSVEDLVLIPSESKGISDDICDVPSCDNDHFDAEFGLIDSLLNDFDEEEGAIDIDILQIEDEILHEKILNVNLLIDKIEALNLTPFIPFVLEYPSSSPIPVVDNDFLIEEVDTFLVSEDSIPSGIESDFDSEGDIIFLDDLHNDDSIPEYERFTFDIEPDTTVINNFDVLNEDECTDIKEMDKRAQIDLDLWRLRDGRPIFVLKDFMRSGSRKYQGFISLASNIKLQQISGNHVSTLKHLTIALGTFLEAFLESLA
ncbi:hypothetical protein Tco_0683906, partial [Tanacetum coccineum]